jgi:hypothetical protein
MAKPSVWLKATLVLGTPQKVNFFNVFWYVPSAAPAFTSAPMTDANTICTAIKGTLVAHLPGCLTTGSAILGINLELNKDGQSYDVTQIINTAGTVESDELADFEAVVLQKRTATPGKSGRGRWYLGPVPETFTDENYRTLDTDVLYNAVLGDWLASPSALTVNWNPQLYSKKTDTFHILTSGFVDPKVGQIGGRKSRAIL